MGIFQQFPYSNFHEFNLDQIIKIMHEMQTEWENTKTEWASYKEFIDNYFANLDVSEEVMEAMRTFAADGTLNEIMDPTIITETTAWLAAHITQPTTPAIDTSLTIAGAAADAKATGDAIKLNSDAIKINDILFHNAYLRDDGTEVPNNDYIATGFMPISVLDTIVIKALESNASLNVHLFDANRNQLVKGSYTNIGVGFDVHVSFASATYIRAWTKATSSNDFLNKIELTTKKDLFPKWVSGFITNSGDFVYQPDYTASYPIIYDFVKNIHVASGLNAHIHYYTKDMTHINRGDLNVGDNAVNHNIENCYYIRIWFNGTHASDGDDCIDIYFGASGTGQLVSGSHEVVVIGDSWSDTDPDHTTYTKWPVIFQNNIPCTMHVYAQNGSMVSGEIPQYGINGNVKGQTQYAINDSSYDHSNVDLVILMAGVNDFRQNVSAADTITAFIARVNEMKASFTNARFVIFINNQIYVTQTLWDYIQTVRDGIRTQAGIPAFSMLGWVNSANYISDLVHVDDTGYEQIAANVIACCYGGPVAYVKNVAQYTVTDSGARTHTISITEMFNENEYDQEITHVVPAGVTGSESLILNINATDKKLICMLPKQAFTHNIGATTEALLNAIKTSYYQSALTNTDVNNRGTAGTIHVQTANNAGTYKGKTV